MTMTAMSSVGVVRRCFRTMNFLWLRSTNKRAEFAHDAGGRFTGALFDSTFRILPRARKWASFSLASPPPPLTQAPTCHAKKRRWSSFQVPWRSCGSSAGVRLWKGAASAGADSDSTRLWTLTLPTRMNGKNDAHKSHVRLCSNLETTTCLPPRPNRRVGPTRTR